jgi:uncharacterized protein
MIKTEIYNEVEKREQAQDHALIPQYRLSTILLIWAAAAIPMGVLGWIVAPALALQFQTPVIVRSAVLLPVPGFAWQFVLALILLYRETGTLRWSTIRQRLWLTTPRSPRTGRPNARLWWWVVPIFTLAVISQLTVEQPLHQLWMSAFPFLAPPPSANLNTLLATPAVRAQLVGRWDVWGVFVLAGVFNTFLGEELLFRGFLLPRMAGVFGKGDWIANGLLYGLYNLHRPWGILEDCVEGILFALPTRLFRSSWFAIIIHSGQIAYLAVLILGLVLNLAR